MPAGSTRSSAAVNGRSGGRNPVVTLACHLALGHRSWPAGFDRHLVKPVDLDVLKGLPANPPAEVD